jgi:hypothetical protein
MAQKTGGVSFKKGSKWSVEPERAEESEGVEAFKITRKIEGTPPMGWFTAFHMAWEKSEQRPYRIGAGRVEVVIPRPEDAPDAQRMTERLLQKTNETIARIESEREPGKGREKPSKAEPEPARETLFREILKRLRRSS